MKHFLNSGMDVRSSSRIRISTGVSTMMRLNGFWHLRLGIRCCMFMDWVTVIYPS
jgi:hypothetical protein